MFDPLCGMMLESGRVCECFVPTSRRNGVSPRAVLKLRSERRAEWTCCHGPPFVELSSRCSRVSLRGYCSRANVNDQREVVMPVWAWVLIIVLLVLLLTGGVYVRR